ncbi:hypothetical protein GFC01_10530 [Desulfofundulus thermobenzoicus]|uniref:Uncharacterized protein n=1 Tax=Desulfofundulus thermobenzoicus TaxID=29376 RepID=A0A6N7IT44_9FIRM|nr:hypothetical protein [Desulfofundulus thermobenzoicus]MQL52689.1 hypothetical protein [Desulfofundulus thermobenzoicus]HHW42418.1 hypothetical protein [Desulfotomaculum sp.]
MRKISYDEYIQELRRRSLQLYTRWAAKKGRTLPSSRPRDPGKDITLFLLDRKRWEQALASGRIEKLGPRRYRWNG